jgi:hypothetical protein
VFHVWLIGLIRYGTHSPKIRNVLTGGAVVDRSGAEGKDRVMIDLGRAERGDDVTCGSLVS